MSSNYLIVIRMSLFFIACSVASNNFADIDKSRLDAVEAEIQTLIDDGKLSGAVLMIAQQGELQMNKALGYKNVEDQTPMETDTIFRIFS